MIRQNGGGSGGSGVQHLTGIPKDNRTLQIDGFTGNAEGVAIVVVVKAVNTIAGSRGTTTHAVLDYANGIVWSRNEDDEIFFYGYASDWLFITLTDGKLEVGSTGVFTVSGTYDVTIYMK